MRTINSYKFIFYVDKGKETNKHGFQLTLHEWFIDRLQKNKNFKI